MVPSDICLVESRWRAGTLDPGVRFRLGIQGSRAHRVRLGALACQAGSASASYCIAVRIPAAPAFCWDCSQNPWTPPIDDGMEMEVP